MQTTAELRMRAEPAVIYPLAAAVERWPTILPHYRWVHVLAEHGPERLVAMAARRDRIPVRWTAVQTLYPAEYRITFRHVAGITTGMQVEWTLLPEPDGTLVRIWHGFRPDWPLVPDALVRRVVGDFFLDTIAGRTLHRIRDLAEAQARPSQWVAEAAG